MPVFDRAFAYGDAIFETLKVLEGQPVFFEDHYQRLREGMERAGITASLDPRGLRNQALSLARANSVSEGRLRILLSRGTPPAPGGVDARKNLAPTLLVTVEPFSGHPPEIYHEGVSCLSVDGNRGRFASIKSTSLMATVLAREEAHRAGAFEALFTGGHGGILEGSISNIFFHDGDGLLTAPDDQPILAGVTRQKVLDIAADMGITVSFEALRLQELDRDATSAFITGSVLGICPVREIDGQGMRMDTAFTGDLSSRLRELERAGIG